MKFLVTFDGEVELDIDEVWPDGNAPKNPTAADVAAVMRKCGRQAAVLDDWNLGLCLTVYVDQERVWS